MLIMLMERKMAKQQPPGVKNKHHREHHAIDPAPLEPKDQQERPTHEQSNIPGSKIKKLPKEPYPDRSAD